MRAVRQPETGRGRRRKRERYRERARIRVLPPLQTPSSVRGKRPGALSGRGRERCGHRRLQEGPCIVSGTERRGRTDRPTHARTDSESGRSENWAQESQNPALCCQPERETDGRAEGRTGRQKVGAHSFPAATPAEKAAARPLSASGAAASSRGSGSPAEATSVAGAVAATALEGSQPTL